MMRPAAVLLLVASIAAVILAFVYVQTKPTIDANLARKIGAIQQRVLPGGEGFIEKKSGEITYYDAFSGDSRVGRVILVRPVGYGGPVDLMVGIADGKVTGVEVLQMKETPGFGDKVNTPKFFKQFLGKTASDPVAVRDDIDAVSGATITSRAFTKGVREALDVDAKLGASTSQGGQDESVGGKSGGGDSGGEE